MHAGQFSVRPNGRLKHLIRRPHYTFIVLLDEPPECPFANVDRGHTVGQFDFESLIGNAVDLDDAFGRLDEHRAVGADEQVLLFQGYPANKEFMAPSAGDATRSGSTW